MSDGVTGPGTSGSQPVYLPPTFQPGVDETDAQAVGKKGGSRKGESTSTSGAAPATRTGNAAFGSEVESATSSSAVFASNALGGANSVYDTYVELPQLSPPANMALNIIRSSASWIGSPYAIALMGMLFSIQETMEDMEKSNLALVLNTMEAEWDAAKTEADLTRKNAEMKFQQAIMQAAGHAFQAGTSVVGMAGSFSGSLRARTQVDKEIKAAELETPKGARDNALQKKEAYDAEMALPPDKQNPKTLAKTKAEYEESLDQHYKVNGYNVGLTKGADSNYQLARDADGNPVKADELALSDPRNTDAGGINMTNRLLTKHDGSPQDDIVANNELKNADPNDPGANYIKSKLDSPENGYPAEKVRINEKTYENMQAHKNESITQKTNSEVQKFAQFSGLGQSVSGILQTCGEIIWGKQIGYNEAIMKELSSIREQYRQLTQSLTGDQRSMHDLWAELQNMVKQALNELNQTARMQ